MGICSHPLAAASLLVVTIVAANSFVQSQTIKPDIHTLQGTFQALIGHTPAGSDEDRHQQFYLQTPENGTIALEIPRWLEESLDLSQISGSYVTVKFIEKAVAGSNKYNRQVISLVKSAPPALNDWGELTNRKESISNFRRGLQQSSTGTAPQGSVKMIVFIMDLTECGTAKPVVTPQVHLLSVLLDSKQFSDANVLMPLFLSYCRTL